MKSLLIIFSLLVLTGCQPKIQEIYIPVPFKIELPKVERPTLTSDKLGEDAGNDDIIRSMEIDISLLINYATSLEEVFTMYNKDTK